MTGSGGCLPPEAGDERRWDSCDFLCGNTLRIVKATYSRQVSDKGQFVATSRPLRPEGPVLPDIPRFSHRLEAKKRRPHLDVDVLQM